MARENKSIRETSVKSASEGVHEKKARPEPVRQDAAGENVAADRTAPSLQDAPPMTEPAASDLPAEEPMAQKRGEAAQTSPAPSPASQAAVSGPSPAVPVSAGPDVPETASTDKKAPPEAVAEPAPAKAAEPAVQAKAPASPPEEAPASFDSAPEEPAAAPAPDEAAEPSSSNGEEKAPAKALSPPSSLSILHVASECMPFIKTGGLADVVGALPRQQARMGHDVYVMIPKYRDIPGHLLENMTYVTHFTVQLGWRTQYCGIMQVETDGVKYLLVDNEFYFGQGGVYCEGNFEAERYSFFCRGVLEALGHLNLYPDILHCHDWQSGMVPFLLKSQYYFNPAYAAIRLVFTIHNLRYQGVYDWQLMQGMLFIDAVYRNLNDLLHNDGCSFIKGGIVFCDAVTTVSPTYAREIQTVFFGEQLEGLLQSRSNALHGILNGIDTQAFNPETDPDIHFNYSSDDLSGKALCKESLQKEMRLALRAEVPLIGMVTRLTAQKGLDLLQHVITELLNHNDVQLAVLGTGESRYMELLQWAAGAYPGRVACCLDYSESLAHRIYAGADLFLMPSLFEPCGLSQMIAMRYGTPPIVRETGGLKDTVIPYNQYTGEGTGYSFIHYDAWEMLSIIEMAVGHFHDKPAFERLIQNAMAKDFSWERSAADYVALYRSLLG
ncbi:MAG: glycogen synthase GlgA [Christensenellales bacterium]|jgi:starch synthase